MKLPFFKNKKYGKYYKTEADKVIPAEFFFKVENGKNTEHNKCYNFLNCFKLGSSKKFVTYSVCRDLKAVFKKCNTPADEYNNP